MLHPRGRDQRMASSKSGAQRSCMRKRGNELSWNEGYELFAVMFAGQHLPMRSSAVVDCQCRSTKRGARTGPLVFSVRDPSFLEHLLSRISSDRPYSSQMHEYQART